MSLGIAVSLFLALYIFMPLLPAIFFSDSLTEENISDELKCGEFKVSNPNSCTNCSVYPRRCNSVPQTIGQASALGYSVLQNLDRQHIDMDNWILRTTGYYVLKRLVSKRDFGQHSQQQEASWCSEFRTTYTHETRVFRCLQH